IRDRNVTGVQTCALPILAIEKHTGTKIDENEVGYLALHIGAAIERRKLKSGPKRCLIVCASGLGTAQLISYKLKSHFGKSLDVEIGRASCREREENWASA